MHSNVLIISLNGDACCCCIGKKETNNRIPVTTNGWATQKA